MSFWVPIALGAAGLAKGIMDEKGVRDQRLLEAEKARYSPWTGIQPQNVQGADVLGSTLQGVTGGMGLSQSMNASGAANELQAQQMKLAERSQENQDQLTQAQLEYYQRTGQIPMQQTGNNKLGMMS